MKPRRKDAPLRAPGHDGKVSRAFFLDRHPTFIIHTVITGTELGRWVSDQASAWERLEQNTLRRRYVPDYVEIDGRPDAEARTIVMVLRAIEEDPDDPILKLPRPERRRLRAVRADKLWNAFYRRALNLPGSRAQTTSVLE